jgi:DNA mismatch repair protein MutS
LEAGEAKAAPARLADDLPLFAAVVEQARKAEVVAAPVGESEVERALRETNPDELTPREALELVYRLRRELLEDEPA